MLKLRPRQPMLCFMDRFDPASLLQSRRVLRGWLLVIGTMLLALGGHLVSAGRNWPLGDWLINYEGGFVRRGLVGELLLLVGRALHLDPVVGAVLLCVACYAVVFAGLWRWIDFPLVPWWIVFALCSPAMLTFPLLSTRAGFHKEVLLYAAIVLSLGLVQRRPRPGAVLLSIWLSVVCGLLILSHEPTIFYVPYLLVIPALAAQDIRAAMRVCLAPAAVSLLSFGVVLRLIGSAATVAAICRSLHATAAQPCADPIGFLTMTRAGQLAMVRENVAEFHYFRYFPVLLVLTLLPLAVGTIVLWRTPALRQSLRLVMGATLVAATASVALFRFGPDWGRWIAMHAVCLTLLLLWLARRQAVQQPEDGGRLQAVHPSRYRSGWVWSAGLLVYAGCWSMPGFGDMPLHGFVGLLLHWR